MKRKSALLLACLFLLLLTVTACSSVSAPQSMAAPPPNPAAEAADRGEGYSNMGAAPRETVSGVEYIATSVQKYGGVGGESRGSAALRESKLIRRAQLYIQSLTFGDAVTALEALTDRLGGYFEHSSMNGGDYYEKNAMRSASFTVRVPQDQYDAFLTAAGDVGHVVSRSQTQEDVGEVYYDTELRLKTQRVKQERLLSLLAKAELMEDIISLESAISETEYQIEQYTSELKRYDALVDYATIQVELAEVLTLEETPVQTVALGARVGNAFGDGLRGFGDGLGNFAVWCAYNFTGLLVFAAVAAVGLIVAWRLCRKRKGGAPEKPDENKPS